jgi:hypothetical protein
MTSQAKAEATIGHRGVRDADRLDKFWMTALSQFLRRHSWFDHGDLLNEEDNTRCRPG